MFNFSLPLKVLILIIVGLNDIIANSEFRYEGDIFDERLYLKSLDNDDDVKVYSYFEFTTVVQSNSTDSDDRFNHCHLFPHSLAEIIRTHDVEELHISLTEGRWRHRYWGYPIIDASPGAELWARFRHGDEVDRKWKSLTSASSGLLCASFNFIDTMNSVSPRLSFSKTPTQINDKDSTWKNLRYATLPREIVCTENLTPWKKLLPCDDYKGLSSLLNARNIRNTNYHSIGLSYKSQNGVIELKQTLSLVYDLGILGGKLTEWSMRKLFGIGLFSTCPIARSSQIFVDITKNNLKLTPESNDIVSDNESIYAVYDMKQILAKSSPFNLLTNRESEKSSKNDADETLHASRYIKDYGKEIGGIITKINNKMGRAITVTYFENIPWFVPIYYHTLKITTHEGRRKIVPIKKFYIPGKMRSRPYYLEVVFRIPARSVVNLSFDFDYTFLKWQEYPPDANHGFYVGSAVITAAIPLSNRGNVTRTEERIVQIRTESFILSLPTPDFSMPYNVICLSCTVVALAFGPIHNITTKRLRLTKNSKKRRSRFAFLNLKFF